MATKPVPEIVPNPDPSALTTENLLREVAHAKENLEIQIKGLRELHTEKFTSLTNQITGIKELADKLDSSAKREVAAAFSAAKEAVAEQQKSNTTAINKSEKDTSDKLTQINLMYTNDKKAADDKINDLKDRVSVVEAIKKGGDGVWVAVGVITGIIIAATGIVVSAIITNQK